ncbi:MAG: prepilin-type N-terminal cleavage/methylation domain-containing protein [Planctomycetota bacterium]|nr:MAG: prepilin-type N-terminal cleavage/methylation domain-containing protein [Planctomycetota bacterium]
MELRRARPRRSRPRGRSRRGPAAQRTRGGGAAAAAAARTQLQWCSRRDRDRRELPAVALRGARRLAHPRRCREPAARGQHHRRGVVAPPVPSGRARARAIARIGPDRAAASRPRAFVARCSSRRALPWSGRPRSNPAAGGERALVVWGAGTHRRGSAEREHRNPEGGLTLLEMLVATALLGVIAVIGIGMVRTTVGAMEEGVERSVQAGRGRAALSMLCNELRQSGRNDPDVADDSQLAVSVALKSPAAPGLPNWITYRRVVGTRPDGRPRWSALTHVFVQLEPGEGDRPNGRDDDGDGFVDEMLLQRLDSSTGQLVTLLTDVQSFTLRLSPDGRQIEIALSVYARTRDGGVDTLSWRSTVGLRNR